MNVRNLQLLLSGKIAERAEDGKKAKKREKSGRGNFHVRSAYLYTFKHMMLEHTNQSEKIEKENGNEWLQHLRHKDITSECIVI